MKRWQRILAGTLAALVLVGGTTWATFAIRHRILYGQVFDESELHPTVEPGDRFSLVVPENGSVGDQWSATVTPADSFSDEGSDHELSSITERLFGVDAGGGSGTRYFTYIADHEGTVTVALFNCFQSTCKFGKLSPYARTVTWTITVK
jgi:inhibitor of cysteine peptidase